MLASFDLRQKHFEVLIHSFTQWTESTFRAVLFLSLDSLGIRDGYTNVRSNSAI